MPTCKKCSNLFPNTLIIDSKLRNLSSRKFCLDCSPFGSKNTTNLAKSISSRYLEEKKCPKCKVVKKREEFYTKGNGRLYSYCRVCAKKNVSSIQKSLKEEAVNYKGGKCISCGYCKCLAALEFHHIDPSQKDFEWKKVKLRSFDNLVKAELDKCVLLCANCHREEHVRLNENGTTEV